MFSKNEQSSKSDTVKCTHNHGWKMSKTNPGYFECKTCGILISLDKYILLLKARHDK